MATFQQPVAARDRTRAGQLDYGQLMQLWLQAGGSTNLAPTMAAIAMAESSGRTDALNDDPATGDYSVGPWQINYFGNLATSRTRRYGSPAQLLRDPLLDAKAAVDLAGDGSGLGNWTTYTNGAYRRYLGMGAGAYGSRGARPGGGGITGFLGGIAHSVASPFESAWDSTVGAMGSVVDFLKLLAWLVNPLTWLRAAEFLAGFVLMLGGLYYYGSATGSSSPASKSQPLAKLPGLGAIATGMVKGLQGTQKARATSGARKAKAASSASREQRAGEMHGARVKTEQARATELRSRSRARSTAARLGKAERTELQRRAYIQGATETASPNLTAAKRKAKKRATAKRA